MTKLAFAAATISALVLATATASGAAVNPPRVGSVDCTANGSVAFGPRLQFSAGRKHNGEPKPDRDANAKFRSDPTECSGSQTGGNPRHPGPIDHAKLVGHAVATGHTCAELTASALRDLKVTITWYDTTGATLGTTKIIAGTGTVSGLGNGVPFNFPPPNNPSPGIVTFHLTGAADASSAVFPGQTVQATLVADQTTDDFPLPCSNNGAPLRVGLSGFAFSGGHRPSTISTS